MAETARDNASTTTVMSELTSIIRAWEDEHTSANYDPVPTLKRLSEIVEVETENYLKMDPDPFDERHPSRTDPSCNLGQILKALFRKDNFTGKLINDYMKDTYYSRLGITGRDVDQLNIAACRLMLDILPGLDTNVVFQPEADSLILRLIKWVTNSVEPLQSYATGLLGAAMETAEIATRFREQNSVLIPLLLQRLRRLKNSSDSTNISRPFAHLSTAKSPPYAKIVRENGITSELADEEGGRKGHKRKLSLDGELQHITPDMAKRSKLDENASPMSPQKGTFSEASNSSWAELETFVIGTVQIFPPTIATRQILILRYLTAMGDYQEFLSHVFEHNALELILCYVNVRVTREARLAFEALKYLAALLCHQKYCIEFIQRKGLEALLDVPRPSIAATGVAICLYYLGYCEEAMERVCMLPKYVVSNLVKYALWLLECSHDSGRCQAIMFFGLTFKFRIILDEFDAQDGLRKLHNVIATLPILQPDSDTGQLNEEQEGAARQIVRHVCVAYRRYTEAHLAIKVELMRRSQLRGSVLPSLPYKACKSEPEEIQEQVDMLFQNMPYRSHWAPVDQLLKLGAINLLLKIVACSYEWNYHGKAETVKSALDVLAIACVIPKVQMLLCDKVDLPDESLTVGMNIILGAAEGEIVADADVQKAALRLIGNCVCSPVNRVGGTVARFSANTTSSPSKKLKYKNSEELVQKVWDCVRSNSGIMVLLQLMQVKTPITDADCIRTLACKALAGLTRSETVRQIVSKLPLFTSGQLQSLMRNPILQEKRQEHVMFQKYALELLELLSGKGKHPSTDLEVSLANIHRANVVAQTKIHFNDRQLLQLIHHHLVQKGLGNTADILVKEANLSNAIISMDSQHPMKFKYSSILTPPRNRTSFSSPRLLPSSSETVSQVSTSNPIRIIKKQPTTIASRPSAPRLEKQTDSCGGSGDHPLPLLPWHSQEDVVLSHNNEHPRITLESIITEYLTNQHALCKNPMAACPPFNLFVPHKCPDPKPKIMATANNFVIRHARRQIGYLSKSKDRRLVHSRFCAVQTIRSSTDEGFFTAAKFMPNGSNVVVGDYNGEIHLFNLHTGSEVSGFSAHENYIVNLEPSRTGEMMLSSATWGKPISALWDMKSYNMKIAFDDEEHVEFSKVTQDKVIGTRGEVATIFDANTGTSVMSLLPRTSNQYTKNKATFSYNDELVLSDGILFDVNSGKAIHKLDKLNQTQSGVFHPNGLEIVSNTEVWDIRTFHLLKTVPILHQCSVIFSPVNPAIYAISMEQEMDDGDSSFDSSFKTVDAVDYTSIATIDVKRSIYDLAVNRFDTQIALVENQGMYNSVQESVVRLYDVGRRRDDEDEQDEEEEEEEDDMDGSDDDDNSDNNDGDNNENNENGNRDEGDENDSSDSWSSLSSVNSNGSSADSLFSNILLSFE